MSLSSEFGCMKIIIKVVKELSRAWTYHQFRFYMHARLGGKPHKPLGLSNPLGATNEKNNNNNSMHKKEKKNYYYI